MNVHINILIYLWKISTLIKNYNIYIYRMQKLTLIFLVYKVN